MTIDDRSFLERIARSLRQRGTGDHSSGAGRLDAQSPAPARTSGDTAALLARFSAEWQALAGHVHAVDTEEQAADTLIGICRSHSADRILSWTPASMGFLSLERSLDAAGIVIDGGTLPDEAIAREERLDALARIAVGVTGADALLAESGSVVVVSDPGRPRLASLLPPVHVAIARTTNVFPSIEALFEARPDLAEQGSNLVAISGPSRTADIEMTLTRGVHGPGEVHVIVVGSG